MKRKELDSLKRMVDASLCDADYYCHEERNDTLFWYHFNAVKTLLNFAFEAGYKNEVKELNDIAVKILEQFHEGH